MMMKRLMLTSCAAYARKKWKYGHLIKSRLFRNSCKNYAHPKLHRTLSLSMQPLNVHYYALLSHYYLFCVFSLLFRPAYYFILSYTFRSVCEFLFYANLSAYNLTILYLFYYILFYFIHYRIYSDRFLKFYSYANSLARQIRFIIA